MNDILYETQKIIFTNNKEKIKISSLTDVENLKQIKDLKEKVQEHFIVITLNNKNVVNSIEVVGIGSNTSVNINCADVLRCALLRNSAAIIVAHNHPSGDSTPSKHDLYMTRKLNSLASFHNIKLLDHIIVGEKILSMAKEELIDNDKDIKNITNGIIEELKEENFKLKKELREERETIKSKIEKAKEKATMQETKDKVKSKDKSLQSEV